MNSGLISVMVVTLVTWIGLFAYLLLVERAVRRLERRDNDKDDL
jgi:CcmD family protein